MLPADMTHFIPAGAFMVRGFAILLSLQLAGELLARGLQLPLPGSVIGMVLLLITLRSRFEYSASLRSNSILKVCG